MKKKIILFAKVNTKAREGNATFRKGPYLVYQNDPSKMAVLWQTDKTPVSSKIFWGDNRDYQSGEVSTNKSSSSPDGHQFRYTFENLDPHQEIHYKVVVDQKSYKSRPKPRRIKRKMSTQINDGTVKDLERSYLHH